jgi:hypothetical protein
VIGLSLILKFGIASCYCPKDYFFCKSEILKRMIKSKDT